MGSCCCDHNAVPGGLCGRDCAMSGGGAQQQRWRRRLSGAGCGLRWRDEYDDVVQSETQHLAMAAICYHVELANKCARSLCR